MSSSDASGPPPPVFTAKARVTAERVRRIIAPYVGPVDEIIALRGGETSQAFRFHAPSGDLVFRGDQTHDYRGDVWAWEHVAGTGIPVPEVLATGDDGDLHWAVSRRAAGTMLYDLPPAEQKAMVPEMIRVLRAIHAVDVRDSRGYGRIIDDPSTYAARWEDWVARALRWPHLDWPTVLRRARAPHRAAMERCWTVAETLLPALTSAGRVLGHGDYNQANLLGDAGRITGVVDWQGAGYGDPLYDVAGADFWTPELALPAAYLRTCPHDGAEQRILCYQVSLAANVLGFFVQSQQPGKGDLCLSRVEQILDGSPTKR